jgi:homocysteine S-methyltransferase
MSPAAPNPLARILARQPIVVLDGGLATALEARGCDLDDALWSARLLVDDPDLIRRVHLDFLEAGADCVTTASYQASLPGFRAYGKSDAEGEALLRLSVRLACEARDAFFGEAERRAGRERPLVAASVGPYGAFLADGSEYTGAYGADEDVLVRFHGRRMKTLATSGADLLACETVPSLEEVRVLVDLLGGLSQTWAWVSVSCRDGAHLCDGTPLADAARLCDAVDNVVAVGVNCTAPQHVTSLIREARRAASKPIVVYPNSGERYDTHAKAWTGAPTAGEWGARAVEWAAAGAAAIGGCCRVGPAAVAAIRRRLVGQSR